MLESPFEPRERFKEMFTVNSVAKYSGWVVATTLLTVNCCLFASIKNEEQEIKNLQTQQQQINQTYIEAWRNQQATAQTIISWGSYVAELKDAIRYNKISKIKMASLYKHKEHRE